jgi:hypothetical protein
MTDAAGQVVLLKPDSRGLCRALCALPQQRPRKNEVKAARRVCYQAGPYPNPDLIQPNPDPDPTLTLTPKRTSELRRRGLIGADAV